MVRDRIVSLVHILLADDEEVYEGGKGFLDGDGMYYGMGDGDGYGDGYHAGGGYGHTTLDYYEQMYGKSDPE